MADERQLDRAVPIRIECAWCGSTEVTRDAWAEWDEVQQAWRLGAIFDDGYCHRCEAERSLVEQPLVKAVR